MTAIAACARSFLAWPCHALRTCAVGAAFCAGLLVAVAPAAAQVSFSGPTQFRVGTFPSLLAVADFNADGHLDIATSNEQSNNVSILLGDGTGGFSAARNFATAANPQMVAVGDFNGDTRPDLAVPSYNTGTVSILLGDGAGHFAAHTDFAAGSNPIGAAVGDFNGDTRLDLAVANQGSGNVSILRGNGAGGFSAPVDFAAGSGPNMVVTADLNADTRLDLAVPNRDSGDVSILHGNGSGGFSAPTNLPAGNLTFQTAVGDFNVDARPDLAVANFFSDASIFLGGPGGIFAAPTHFSGGDSPNSVAAADFNSDTLPDLVFSNFNQTPTSKVAIFLGNGTGHFTGPTLFATNRGSNNVGVGDFNGDSRPDLAVTNLFSNDVSILLNTTGSPSAYRETVLADHPLGYWRFGEPAGRTARDSSPYGNDGVYRGGPVLGAGGAIAHDPDTAVRLDGRDDSVRIPDSPSLRTGDHFSLELWLKRDKLSTAVQTEGLFLRHYQLYLDGNGQIVLRKPRSRAIARSRSRITDTTRFHHVVATKAGKAVHIYVDGVDVTGKLTHATIANTPGNLSIGAGANTFRGTLDEAAIYDHALTAAQVARHHAAGR